MNTSQKHFQKCEKLKIYSKQCGKVKRRDFSARNPRSPGGEGQRQTKRKSLISTPVNFSKRKQPIQLPIYYIKYITTQLTSLQAR